MSASFFGFSIITIAIILDYRKKQKSLWEAKKAFPKGSVFTVLIFTYCIQFLSYIVMGYLKVPEFADGSPYSQYKDGGSWGLLFITFVLVGPLCEELVFRRELYSRIERRFGWLIGFIISNLFFAIIHIELRSIVHAGIMGGVFTFLYSLSGSVLVPFLSHAFGNLIAFLLIFIFPGTPFYIDRINSFPQAIYLVFIILLSGFLFKKLLNIYAKTDHEQINHPNKKKQ